MSTKQKYSDEELKKLIPKSAQPKNTDQKNIEMSDKEIDKWIESISPEQYAYSNMSMSERFASKWNEGPLVFVFFGATVACLTVGLGTLKTKNQKLSQMMMRGRVFFQGACVVSLVATLGHQDQFMEGAQFFYDRKTENEAKLKQKYGIQDKQKSVTEIVQNVIVEENNKQSVSEIVQNIIEEDKKL
jgi:hypothetical protein